jgi:GTP-binding nuclear protein Ran
LVCYDRIVEKLKYQAVEQSITNHTFFYNNMIGCWPKKTSIKIALVGDGAVGKTSFFNRLTNGDTEDYKFSKNYDATTGCNVCQIELMVDRTPIKLHLFDTAGQEQFGDLRDSYLMGVDGIVLMYDITDRTTKQNVMTKWLPEIKRILSASKNPNYVPVMVVGNKNDRVDSIVSDELVALRLSTLTGCYDAKYGSVNHCVMSVKANDNLMQPINWLLQKILAYFWQVDAKKSDKKPIVSYCNK